MAETSPAAPRSPGEDGPPGTRVLRYTAAWLTGALPAFAVLTALWIYPADFGGVGGISLGAFALMFPVAVRQLKVPRRVEFVHFLLGAGLVFCIVSVLTGAANGLTDEAYTMPRYVGLLLSHQDPYTVPLVFDYTQYGHPLHSQTTYLYGPLLMFLQVPGLDYKWFAVGGWVILVLLVRKRFDIAVMLAQPYVAIIAANGYNDLVVLVFLSLAFVGYEGRRQKWAQWLSLGMKQFANVFVLAYYVVRRDWRNFTLTAAISAAFILPFLLWSGKAVLCPALLMDQLPSCGTGGPSYLADYSLWVIWGVAIFYYPFVRAARRLTSGGRWKGLLEWSGFQFDELLRLPAFVVVGVSGVFVNLCVFTLLGVQLGHATSIVLLASAAAFGVALLWNFSWNRSWAFQGRGDRSVAYHLAIYGAIQATALGVNLGVLALGVDLGEGALESQLVGIVLGSVIGYVANLRWNFRAPRPVVPA